MKNAKDIKKSEILKLQKEVARHNKLYYEQSEPEISDAEYDNITKRLRELEGDSNYQTDLFTLGMEELKTSITIQSKNESVKFAKTPHISPMLSLGNVFDETELQDFIKRINNFLNTENEFFEFTAEKKIDGVSFSALYEGGSLVHVLTRGDGNIGENITENILTIQGFPTKISLDCKMEIRGEVYMLNSDFEELNAKNTKSGQKVFANPRNAASGSLRQLDSSLTKERNLKYYAYSAIFHSTHSLKTQAEIYNFLQKNSFCVNDYAVCKNVEDMLKYYNSVAKNRFEIGYDIDGIVYKINSLELQQRLGTTSNAPRWAVAHKFSSKKARTQLENITLQVGRTGIITPVADLIPVNLGGVIIKRATLHNKDEISRLQINIGDVVEIERAGDVIPKILSVCEKKSEGIFKFPQVCPCCGTELTQVDTLIRCMNFSNCREQVVGRLQYFVSKECFNIVGLGGKQIEEFYSKRIITNYADIFLLPSKIEEINLKDWDGWGEISVKNLIDAIEKAKNVDLSKLINAFGIYSVGIENAKILAGFFQNGNRILEEIKLEEILALDGIGEKTASEVINYLEKNRDEIQNLLLLITVMHEVQIKGTRGAVLFTGTLSISRAEAKEIAQKAEFSIASTVSKNLEYLIVGKDAGSKLKKANELGVTVITEEEFIELCKIDFNSANSVQ